MPKKKKVFIMPSHRMMPGHIVFRFSVRAYVGTCVRTNVCTYVHIRSCQTQVKAFVPGRILQFYSQVPYSAGLGVRVLWTHF